MINKISFNGKINYGTLHMLTTARCKGYDTSKLENTINVFNDDVAICTNFFPKSCSPQNPDEVGAVWLEKSINSNKEKDVILSAKGFELSDIKRPRLFLNDYTHGYSLNQKLIDNINKLLLKKLREQTVDLESRKANSIKKSIINNFDVVVL